MDGKLIMLTFETHVMYAESIKGVGEFVLHIGWMHDLSTCTHVSKYTCTCMHHMHCYMHRYEA